MEGAVGRRGLRRWQELTALRGDMIGVAQQRQVSLQRGTVLCGTAAVLVFLGVVIHTFVSWEQNAGVCQCSRSWQNGRVYGALPPSTKNNLLLPAERGVS